MKVHGHDAKGAPVARGIVAHEEIGDELQELKAKQRRSSEYALNIKIFSLIAILLALNGVVIVIAHEFTTLLSASIISNLLLILAVGWLTMALFFFLRIFRLSLCERRLTGETSWAFCWLHNIRQRLAKSVAGGAGDSPHPPALTRRHMVWFLVITGVLALTGILILYPPPAPVFSRFFTVSALLWLLATLFFLYLALLRERSAASEAVAPDAGRGDARSEGTRKGERKGTDKVRKKWNGSERGAHGRLGADEKLIIGFAAVASFLAFNAIMLERRPSASIGIYILILAFLWLLGTFIFFYFSFRKTIRLRRSSRSLLRGAEQLFLRRFRVRTRSRSAPETVNADAGQEDEGTAGTNTVSAPAPGFGHADEDKRQEERVALMRRERELMRRSERGVLWFALVSLVLSLNSMIFYFRPMPAISNILEIIAMVWLIGAFFFFYHYLKSSQLADRLRRLHGLFSQQQQLAYTDMPEGTADLLVSQQHGIRGRPDYILYDDETDDYIPIEVKTGRVPRGPYFSHILQLAAYALLVEETYGACDHGKLRYIPTDDTRAARERGPVDIDDRERTMQFDEDEARRPVSLRESMARGGGRSYEIQFDEELKALLLAKVAEMREIYETGEAHRNHNRPGKCRHCSRRDACPERLV